MLYMTEQILSGIPDVNFSYIDHVEILGVGKSVKESGIAAQREVRNLLDWSNQNSLYFDLEKTEFVQFPGW